MYHHKKYLHESKESLNVPSPSVRNIEEEFKIKCNEYFQNK